MGPHTEKFAVQSPLAHHFLPLARPSPDLGRTSFSLAEVKTEEPVKPGGQPQGHVATLLMFEWTLRIKQESEGPKV